MIGWNGLRYLLILLCYFIQRLLVYNLYIDWYTLILLYETLPKLWDYFLKCSDRCSIFPRIQWQLWYTRWQEEAYSMMSDGIRYANNLVIKAAYITYVQICWNFHAYVMSNNSPINGHDYIYTRQWFDELVQNNFNDGNCDTRPIFTVILGWRMWYVRLSCKLWKYHTRRNRVVSRDILKEKHDKRTYQTRRRRATFCFHFI